MRRVILAVALLASTAAHADTALDAALGFPQRLRDLLTQGGWMTPEINNSCNRHERKENGCLIAIGIGALRLAQNAPYAVAVGSCAGANLLTGSDDLFLGNFTAAPSPDISNFVNLDNLLCWHDRIPVTCPLPLTAAECGAPVT